MTYREIVDTIAEHFKKRIKKIYTVEDNREYYCEVRGISILSFNSGDVDHAHGWKCGKRPAFL